MTVKPITSRNPQANSMLERVHQIIGNIIRTLKVQNIILDDENPGMESWHLLCSHCVQRYIPQRSISIWTTFNFEHKSRSKLVIN